MKKLEIILIEDEPAVARLLQRVLQAAGHEVRIYDDPTVCPVYTDHGAHCSQKKACADVILSDQMMPNMTGLEFFALQRERGCKAPAENKALITAAELTPELEAKAKSLGCLIFRKPFNFKRILKWVDECATRVNKES